MRNLHTYFEGAILLPITTVFPGTRMHFCRFFVVCAMEKYRKTNQNKSKTRKKNLRKREKNGNTEYVCIFIWSNSIVPIGSIKL